MNDKLTNVIFLMVGVLVLALAFPYLPSEKRENLSQ
jgi:hypothetical protein